MADWDTLDADSKRREFSLLMEQADLNQRDLAALTGTAPMTVNRWLTTRGDGFPPPFYAFNFLRAYVQLPDGARMRLPRLAVGQKKAKAG